MRLCGSGRRPTPECTDESFPEKLRCLELSHSPLLLDGLLQKQEPFNAFASKERLLQVTKSNLVTQARGLWFPMPKCLDHGRRW